MRTAFIKQLTEEAKVNKKIFLLCGDVGFSVLEPFAKLFPDRFINAGIAEQNMVSVAAGLSLEGYNVFIYSIGNFPTLRALEQIRYGVAYHKANVKIISTGAGYAYGPLSTSHHTTEDLSILRSIPNMVVTSPCDPVESKKLAQFLSHYAGPAYIRINKAGEPILHKREFNLKKGNFFQLLQGANVAVLGTGSILAGIFDEIKRNHLNWSLYSFPFVKPIDKKAFNKILLNYEYLVTVEEHQLDGGFGSMILESANDLFVGGKIKKIPKIFRLGIPNKFLDFSGSQEFLKDYNKINLKQIIEKIK